jgi:phage terminase small subunit
MALSDKQQRFCEEYLIDLDASAAYRRAGYNPKSENVARSASGRLLLNVAVQEEVKRLKVERSQRTGITADRVLSELAAIGFSDIGDLLEFTATGVKFKPQDQIPEAARRAVSAVKVRHEYGSDNSPPADVLEFKIWPKVDALKQLVLHLGLIAPVKMKVGADPDSPLPIMFMQPVFAAPPSEPANEHADAPSANGHTNGSSNGKPAVNGKPEDNGHPAADSGDVQPEG